jgi:hypothetical protein
MCDSFIVFTLKPTAHPLKTRFVKIPLFLISSHRFLTMYSWALPGPTRVKLVIEGLAIGVF